MNIENLRKSFERGRFEFNYFETKKEANNYIMENVKNKKVSFGGSITLQEMGLYELLSKNNEMHWHWKDKNDITQVADVYFTSANALSENGEIVNIDGLGNRVSAAIYGCSEVYVVCGINKIEKDLESAMYRAKNIAAPKNAKRLNKNTPCAVKVDKCYNCASDDRICAATTIVNFKPMGVKRYNIIVVGEELGY